MEIVNQLAGSLAQSAAVTRQQSTDKSQQVRRAQALRKDVAAAADTFEHQVESAEELTPIHEEQKQPNGRRRQKPKPHPPATVPSGENDQPTRVDVTG